MALTEQAREDIKRLRRLVTFVRDALRWLTPQGEQWLRAGVIDTAGSFVKSLPQVDAQLETIQEDLDSITENADERLSQLTAVGLTGDALVLKESVLRKLLSTFRVSPRRILKWINSFLGSLAKVEGYGAGCDLAKEFKEMLEFVVWTIHRPPKELKPILDLN
jgi:hypothetical protein